MDDILPPSQPIDGEDITTEATSDEEASQAARGGGGGPLVDGDDGEEGSKLHLDDKASFREKSSLLKVLENSSKFRKKPLPEPSKNRPGRLEGINSPRPDGDRQDNEVSVGGGLGKLSLPPCNRPLARAKDGSSLRGNGGIYGDPQKSVKSGTNFESLSLAPRLGGGDDELGSPPSPSSKSMVSLPPLASNDKHKMKDILTYSRHRNDITNHLKGQSLQQSVHLTVPSIGAGGSAPNSPRGTPVSARRAKDQNSNKITLTDAATSLAPAVSTPRK